jgi:TolA-binding protein
MMIDDDTLKQLLRINDELLQLCKCLNEKRDMETSSRLIPLVDKFYPHSARSWQEQVALKPQEG